MNMIEDVWQTRYCHPTQWDQAFAPLTLPDMFLGAAQRHPDAPFLDFLGRRYSYAAVAKAVRHAAAGFEALGIQPGDRVGLFLPNVPHYVAAYYGALLAGAIVVNFSPLYTVDELAAQARDSGTKLIVTLSSDLQSSTERRHTGGKNGVAYDRQVNARRLTLTVAENRAGTGKILMEVSSADAGSASAETLLAAALAGLGS